MTVGLWQPWIRAKASESKHTTVQCVISKTAWTKVPQPRTNKEYGKPARLHPSCISCKNCVIVLPHSAIFLKLLFKLAYHLVVWCTEGWSWPDLNRSRQSLLYSRSFSNTALWDIHVYLCDTLCVCHAAAGTLPSWHCWTFLPSPWRGSNWGKSCWNSMLLYSVPFVDGR